MLFLFLISCEQVDTIGVLQVEQAKSPYKIKTVKLSDIPEIKDFLNSNTTGIFYKGNSKIDGAIFDEDNILEVIDTLQRTNYSFHFVFPDTPEGTFYNLVVGKTPDGETKEPIVLKFTSDESQLDEFISNNNDYKFFKGDVAIHKYTDFFETGRFYKGDTAPCQNFDEFGDPVPCDNLNVGTGSNGGGDGTGGPAAPDGGTTSGTNSGTGTGGGIAIDCETTVTGCWCEGYNVGVHDHEETVITWDCYIYEYNKGDFDNCPDCPTSSNGGIGVNTTTTTNSINLILGNTLNNNELIWLSDSKNSIKTAAIKSFLKQNSSVEAKEFVKLAIQALMQGIDVDFDEAYINTQTPDDNYVYQGPKQLISNPLVLSNGDEISVTFITFTMDNISSNQQVSIDLINGMKFAIEQANSNLSLAEKITSINIYATTNGNHGTDSNHYDSTAADINRINGKRMAETGLTNQIIELQKAFDNFNYIRENFGPSFKHKFSVEETTINQWNYNYPVGDHSSHIHISVRR